MGGFSIMIRFIVIFLLLISTVSAAGCTPEAPVDEGIDYDELVDELRLSGADVELLTSQGFPGDSPGDDIFTGYGKRFLLNGETISVLEYEDSATAEAEAEYVSSDGWSYNKVEGRVGIGIDVEWVAPPHWYYSGRVIVLYIGENREVADLLKNVLGEQFAGD
jgi:hypothetical protein